MKYAELQITTHFSFLRGASSADELFARAAELGIEAVGVVDRNSLAGIVRAWEAAKTTGVRLVVGCRLDLADGMSILVYAPLIVHCRANRENEGRRGGGRQRQTASRGGTSRNCERRERCAAFDYETGLLGLSTVGLSRSRPSDKSTLAGLKRGRFTWLIEKDTADVPGRSTGGTLTTGSEDRPQNLGHLNIAPVISRQS
ncbi:hypothetical protein A7J57_00790 [Agrobacterium tumefaciens]|uniref:Polymerase/histidinol phosphatase N-terminal domain-containing protein n=1 Tax=Agrobacterium tumefaciens TaxID=358 RepID=A0A176XGU5_AGRTU|nr:hypothetical protein A7J57_00790 [Agrobacterium tumefaciens]